jgi:hypothetical protein
MKYESKEYHIWKHKATNKVIGKIVEIKDDDSIENYVEVELPEPLKKIVDKIKEFKKQKENA